MIRSHLGVVHLDVRHPQITGIDPQNVDTTKVVFIPLHPARTRNYISIGGPGVIYFSFILIYL